MRLTTCDTQEMLAATLSERLVQVIDAALTARGSAFLALAGGRTAPPVFRRLSERVLDFSSVCAVPTDERWVPHSHPDCNLSAAKAAFAGAPGLRWLALTPAVPHGAVDADFAEQQLAGHPHAFDAVLLGMGADGHFASLFPGAPTLAAALDIRSRSAAIAIVPEPMPTAGPHPRISLTLARLLNARRVMLAITGADKRDTLERAHHDRLPIAALLDHCPDLDIVWAP